MNKLNKLKTDFLPEYLEILSFVKSLCFRKFHRKLHVVMNKILLFSSFVMRSTSLGRWTFVVMVFQLVYVVGIKVY